MLSLQLSFGCKICSYGFDLFSQSLWTQMIQMICVTSVLWQPLLHQVDVKVPVLTKQFSLLVRHSQNYLITSKLVRNLIASGLGCKMNFFELANNMCFANKG